MGSEITQLFLIIAALVIAYGGVKFWSNRSGQSKESSPVIPGPGDLEGGSGKTPRDRATSSRDGSGSKKDRERFNLTGRDAEVAARVLKRMLKQGREGK